MAEMQEYVIAINGIEHTFQLSDEDAKARGLKAKAAETPKNKAVAAAKAKD